ncbi:MAG: phenylalanine--tRNA ligase subunit beta [Actinomycetes bacterium]
MRIPMSWLREYVDVPEASARDIAERLIAAGLEVETVEQVGAEIVGPIVIARVLEFVEEAQSNGKTIRWCRVDVGPEHNDAEGGRGIVCGALNFAVGDVVVVCLPGSTLPGGFEIAARKTYGHVSDGMICSNRELGLSDEHAGILVLPATSAPLGTDAIAFLELREDVLDIAVTPDRGYALSVRGVAREVATAYRVAFRDPAAVSLSKELAPDWPVEVADLAGCTRFVTRSVTGFDPSAPSPRWLSRRVTLAGIRSISLAVDITNYVMLELGQPLHAYDRALLSGPIVVRRARAGETITTLDDSKRTAVADDLLITDDSGPIGLAGVMGGASTEIRGSSTEILIEVAHFDAVSIARTARRQKLPSEASRRFERGVDSQVQEAAAERAIELLVELGGATALAGRTVASAPVDPPTIELDLGLPQRLVGMPISGETVRSSLTAIGAGFADLPGDRLVVTPPSWRPDLRMAADLVEEVARLVGYEQIPSLLPKAPGGRGLTLSQRIRSRVGRELAGAGFVEVLNYPFVSVEIQEQLGLADERFATLRLANPMSEEEPYLRASLLPGVLTALRRNVGRGNSDSAIFESGLVFRSDPGQVAAAPRPAVDARPTDAQIAAVVAAVPPQPRHIAVALAGNREARGWWGAERQVEWGDAVAAAHIVAHAVGVMLEVTAGDLAPWHSGRCAALLLDGQLVGHAGELHPRALEDLGLPPRSAAMELDLDALLARAGDPVRAPSVSTYPVAKEDVALVVPIGVPASKVAAALAHGAGAVLESVRLFDVYEGEQVGPGLRSMAFALRFRAADHTLEPGEVLAAREAALAGAAQIGALLRGGAGEAAGSGGN